MPQSNHADLSGENRSGLWRRWSDSDGYRPEYST